MEALKLWRTPLLVPVLGVNRIIDAPEGSSLTPEEYCRCFQDLIDPGQPCFLRSSFGSTLNGNFEREP